MSLKKLKLDELGRLSPDEYKDSEKNNIVVVLDNIRSMHNVGSVFRSADAFRIQKIYLCGYTAKPPHRDIRKVAIGAEETVEWEHQQDITQVLAQLKKEGLHIVAIEQTHGSNPITRFHYDPKQPVAFVMGNEVDGVQDKALQLCDQALEIPQFGTKHSLNVSVTTGIVLFWAISSMTSAGQAD